MNFEEFKKKVDILLFILAIIGFIVISTHFITDVVLFPNKEIKALAIEGKTILEELKDMKIKSEEHFKQVKIDREKWQQEMEKVLQENHHILEELLKEKK